MKFFNKIGPVILLIIAAVLLLPYSVFAGDLKSFQKEVVNPVVQLERNCSGVVIDTSDENKTFIVTAEHCVTGDKSGRVNIDIKDKQKLISTEQHVFDVIVRDVEDDVAFLQLRKEGLNLEGATIGKEDPQEGEPVWVVGYPLGKSRLITSGFFGGFDSLDLNKPGGFSELGDYRPVYRASPAIIGGSSGGGMFVEGEDGYKLVGITHAGFPNFFVASFFNPQEAINNIVERGLKIVSEQDKPKLIEPKS